MHTVQITVLPLRHQHFSAFIVILPRATHGNTLTWDWTNDEEEEDGVRVGLDSSRVGLDSSRDGPCDKSRDASGKPAADMSIAEGGAWVRMTAGTYPSFFLYLELTTMKRRHLNGDTHCWIMCCTLQVHCVQVHCPQSKISKSGYTHSWNISLSKQVNYMWLTCTSLTLLSTNQ